MEKTWLLVEWIQKDILYPSFDVVNAKCLVGNTRDVCVGKLSILREKYSNNTRPAQVLYISDNKHSLKKMKCMLVRLKEQMRITVEMCKNTIDQLKTEIMGDCPISNKNHTSSPGLTNSKCIVNSTPKIEKSRKTTKHQDTQTEKQYSAKYINKLRKSLSSGYEKLTRVVSLLKEDDSLNEGRNSFRENSSNKVKSAARKSKRDKDDDFIINGPLMKKLRASNETIVIEMIEDPKTEFIETSNSTHSMRQYVNRKVLTPVNNILEPIRDTANQQRFHNDAINITKTSAKSDHEMTLENIDTSRKVISNIITMAASENKENTNMKHENNNTISYSDSEVKVDTAAKKQEDMVPIGKGYTLIPKRVYDSLDWNSYTSVTRKLLQAVFSRETLSTHSLSGKPSPAFSNKPAKKRLDPLTIDDIVLTVSKECDIKESFVRTCITIKCADEAKMLRQRMSRSRGKNDENTSCPVKIKFDTTV